MRIFQLLSTIAYGDAVSLTKWTTSTRKSCRNVTKWKRQSSRWDIRQEYMPKA